jgi:hypothetical protein
MSTLETICSPESPGMYDFTESQLPIDEDSAINGHGTGFRAQRIRKSSAYRDGRMMRLACRYDGAKPDVTVVWSPFRDALRILAPVSAFIDAQEGGGGLSLNRLGILGRVPEG